MDRDTPATEPNNPEAARRRLAATVRALASTAVLTSAGDAAIEVALALASEALSVLSPVVRSSRYEGIAGLAPGAATNDAVWETHAVFGASNPLAPPSRCGRPRVASRPR